MKFKTSHDLLTDAKVQIKMPAGLTLEALSGSYSQGYTVNSLPATAIIEEGQTIDILDFIGAGIKMEGGFQFEIKLRSITNQISTQDAGGYTVTTFNKIGDARYPVDSGSMATSFVADPGKITSSPTEAITIEKSVNDFNAAVYTMKFVLESRVPISGYYKVQFPPQIKLDISTTFSTGSCRDLTCVAGDEHSLLVLLSSDDADKFAAGTTQTLIVGGVTNPRSMKETEGIVITSTDTNPDYSIDTGYNFKVTMEEAGPITSFSITPTNTMNGVVNKYTFAVQALIPVIKGDKFTMTFPPEVTPPSQDDIGTACIHIANLLSIACTVEGQKVTFEINDFVQSTGAFSWSIDGIKNPGSTKTSSPFTLVHFTDADDFVVSSYEGNGLPDVTVTNQEPNEILIDENSIEQ